MLIKIDYKLCHCNLCFCVPEFHFACTEVHICQHGPVYKDCTSLAHTSTPLNLTVTGFSKFFFFLSFFLSSKGGVWRFNSCYFQWTFELFRWCSFYRGSHFVHDNKLPRQVSQSYWYNSGEAKCNRFWPLKQMLYQAACDTFSVMHEPNSQKTFEPFLLGGHFPMLLAYKRRTVRAICIN